MPIYRRGNESLLYHEEACPAGLHHSENPECFLPYKSATAMHALPLRQTRLFRVENSTHSVLPVGRIRCCTHPVQGCHSEWDIDKIVHHVHMHTHTCTYIQILLYSYTPTHTSTLIHTNTHSIHTHTHKHTQHPHSYTPTHTHPHSYTPAHSHSLPLTPALTSAEALVNRGA